MEKIDSYWEKILVEKDSESESSIFLLTHYDDSLLLEKEIYRLNDVTKVDDDQFEEILKNF